MRQLTPSPELYGRIINSIGYEQQLLILKRKFFFNAALLTTFSLLLTASLRAVWRQMNESGFVDLARLMASDFSVVSNHFHDYVLSLAEALPIISTGLLGITLLFVLVSAWKLLGYSLELKQLNSGHEI